jgi:hypothetical protein
MTPVYCLSEPERVQVYSLPPRQAVFAALQQSMKKHNTWLYEQDSVRQPPVRSRHGWWAGEFWARDVRLPDWAFRQGELL